VDDDEALFFDFADRDVAGFAIVMPRILGGPNGTFEYADGAEKVDPAPSLKGDPLALVPLELHDLCTPLWTQIKVDQF
jgi:hypothetical protein